LDDSDILAFGQDGTGGNVTLPIFFGQNFFSFISVPPGTDPATLDLNGRVDVSATGQLLFSGLTFTDEIFTELPETLLNTDTLVARSCIVPVVQQDNGRFVLMGRDGLPQQPETTNSSTLSIGTIRSLPDESMDEIVVTNAVSSKEPNAVSTTDSHSGDSITEPQAIYQLPDGRLVMSRDCT
jgi:hypothetical protein